MTKLLKFILCGMAVLISGISLWGQTISFAQSVHNFGLVAEEKGSVSCVFPFTNTGDKPLVITAVRVDCGCTTPGYSLAPVEPGQSGQISVSFDPERRPGGFVKKIRVFSNSGEEPFVLQIKGTVVPLGQDEDNGFGYSVGALQLSASKLEFGVITNTRNQMLRLMISNNSEQPLRVTFTPKAKEITLSQPEVTLKPHEPAEVVLTATCNPRTKPGMIQKPIRVDLWQNGTRVAQGEVSVSLPAIPQINRKDEFAPRLELRTYYDLGIVSAEKPYEGTVALQNVGAKPLELYGVYPRSKAVKAKITKRRLAPGEQTRIVYSIDTKAVAASESRNLVDNLSLLCNDPTGPLRKIRIMARIE